MIYFLFLEFRLVPVLKAFWKYQKWKDHTFLHRNYTPTFFSSPKKIFFRVRKKNPKLFQKSEEKPWQRQQRRGDDGAGDDHLRLYAQPGLGEGRQGGVIGFFSAAEKFPPSIFTLS